jgi:hypothetical protein
MRERLEGAKAMERRLSGANAGSFLIASDIAGTPGFAAKRGSSMAVRHQFGRAGITFSGETGSVWQEVKTTATGSPYRYASVAADKSFGRNWLSIGVSRLEEKQSLLGGRLSGTLGAGGANTMFVDAEARHNFGSGLTATATARRGWTDFAGGKFRTGAYGFDLAKRGVLSGKDNIGLRLSQPLRVEHGGLAMLLPTSQALLKDASDAVELWALRGAQAILPTSIQGGADQLVPAIIPIGQTRPHVINGVYDALALPTKVAQVLGVVIPAIHSVLDARIKQDVNGMPYDAFAEVRPF